MLTIRQLNRCLLARQGLLERSGTGVDAALARFAGLPATDPSAPYLGLWSRVEGFRSKLLVEGLDDRRLVRGTLFRGEPHVVTAADWLVLRPLVQPAAERAFWVGSPHARQVADLDVDELLDVGREVLGTRARSRSELAGELAERWPRHDPLALAHAVGSLLPVVEVPPDGGSGSDGEPRWTTTEAWLGRPLAPRPARAEVLTRYLAAFGPATAEDVQAWSGVTDLGRDLRDLGSRVRVDRDDQGALLYDLDGAPRPPEDVPAPVRFLPALDNVLVGHHDRSRLVAEDDKGTLHRRGGGACPVVLVGGHARATWTIRREAGAAVLAVEPLDRLRRGDEREIEAEGLRLLAYAALGADDYDVRVAPPS